MGGLTDHPNDICSKTAKVVVDCVVDRFANGVIVLIFDGQLIIPLSKRQLPLRVT